MMDGLTKENQTFSKLSQWPLRNDDSFSGCRFEHCDFQQANVSGLIFEDCVFEDCNLSLLDVKGTAFKGVKFTRCKVQGISFYEASHFLFSVSFKECVLNFASFSGMILKKTMFDECSLRDVVFTQTNLTGSIFKRCDLARTVFQRSILDKADFTTSYNYVMDPDANSLKKTRFSLYGLPGLLEKYGIEIEEIS